MLRWESWLLCLFFAFGEMIWYNRTWFYHTFMTWFTDKDPPGDMRDTIAPEEQIVPRVNPKEEYSFERRGIRRTSREGAYDLSTRAGTWYGETVYRAEDRENGKESARDMREKMRHPDFFIWLLSRLLSEIRSYSPEGQIQALNRFLDDLHRSGFSLQKRPISEGPQGQYPRGYARPWDSYIVVDANNAIVPWLTQEIAAIPPTLFADTLRYRAFLSEQKNTSPMIRVNTILRKWGIAQLVDDTLLHDRSAIANLKTLVSQSRLSLVERTYIFSFLEDPSSLSWTYDEKNWSLNVSPSPWGEVSLVAQEIAKKTDTLGKPIEPLTVEKFLRNPLSAIPHFFENLGFSGTLSLVGVIIASLIGSDNKWIKYPRIIMGTYLVAKWLWATDFVINAWQWYKTNNMFWKLWEALGENIVNPSTTWIESIFQWSVNLTREWYEHTLFWIESRDHMLVDPLQKNTRVAYMDARVATLSVLQDSDTMKRKALAIEKSGKPISDYTNNQELENVRHRLDILDRSAREKLRKQLPNIPDADIQNRLTSIKQSYTLKEYIAWIFAQDKTVPQKSSPPEKSSSIAPEAPVAPDVPDSWSTRVSLSRPSSEKQTSSPVESHNTEPPSVANVKDATPKWDALDPNTLPNLS